MKIVLVCTIGVYFSFMLRKSIAIRINTQGATLYTLWHPLAMQVSALMRQLSVHLVVQGVQILLSLSWTPWQPLAAPEPWPRNGVRTPPPDAEIRKICEQFYLTSDSDESQTQSAECSYVKTRLADYNPVSLRWNIQIYELGTTPTSGLDKYL